MAYYSDEIIEQVIAANDIVDVIGAYVKLKKSGGNYFGLCPFHSEKTGSFSVSPSKQIYHCFGCAEGGNVVSFIKKYENYSFPEAIKYLADKAGIALPEEDMSEKAKKERSRREKLLAVQKDAAAFYFKMLRCEHGEIGMNYFMKRQLSRETMQSFGLGFALKSGGLYSYLKQAGYEDEILRESGLFFFDEARGVFDKFWNRVMFPIMDANNRVIGFGGRVMGEGEPKYLNSPETRIFDKGRNLYALNKARLHHGKPLIVCEGYMDVISMHQAGFGEAVATLGTAMTSGHASLLKRYTSEVILSYDSDNAGTKAALRAIPILKSAGISARVLNLSPYKDPDEFIKAEGNESFQKRLDAAENSLFFELRADEGNYMMSDPEGRTRFFENTSKKLAAIENEIERISYIEAVASKYMIDPAVLKRNVAKFALSDTGTQREELIPIRKKEESVDGNVMAQRLLLTWLCEEKAIYNQINKYIEVDDFEEGINRKVAKLLFNQLENDNVNPSLIVNAFEDEEEHKTVSIIFNTELQNNDEPDVRAKAITDLVVKLKTNSFKKKVDANSNLDPLQKAIENRKVMDEIKKIKINL